MRALRSAAVALLLATGCAGDGTGTGGFWFDAYYYDSWYYGDGCCVDPPEVIGPDRPHVEHPIVLPDNPKPSQPIANPSPPRPAPVSRPMAAPRPAARGGGGRR